MSHMTHAVEWDGVSGPAKSKKVITAGRRLWDGRRLCEIRKAVGFSQPVLVAKSGVSKSDISRHENNDALSNPTVEVLGALALALDVPLSILVAHHGAPILQTAAYQRFCTRLMAQEFKGMDEHKVFTYTDSDGQKSVDHDTLGLPRVPILTVTSGAQPTAQVVPPPPANADRTPAQFPVAAIQSLEKAATDLKETAAYLVAATEQLRDTLSDLHVVKTRRQNAGAGTRTPKRAKTRKRSS